MKVLLDLDVIVYRAGYAAKNGDFLMNVEYVDNQMFNILDKFMPCDYTGFLSGRDNFRYKVAKTKPYKGNRKPENRPRYYKDLREYLITFWNAEVIHGMEADDAMGLMQNDDTVICSIDKDLKQIPGKHFNFVKNEEIEITPEEGVYNFLRQMLIGDVSDNIPGIDRIGEVKSERLLKGKPPKEQLKIVEQLYEKQYGANWCETFDEIATLLWIKHKDAETYKDCKLLYE